MRNCIPEENGTIAVGHEESYITLMILYNEHIKLEGSIVRFTKKRLIAELLNYIDKPIYFDEILSALFWEEHIQENAPTKSVPEITYSITIKGAAEFQKFKKYKPYIDCMAKAKEIYGKEIIESDFFQMGGYQFKDLQSSLGLSFYADFLEHLEEQRMLRRIGLIPPEDEISYP